MRSPALCLALVAALACGCGRFVPPEETGRKGDLLTLARAAVKALRERDYQLLYALSSEAYRKGRSYEEFLARNRAAETPYRLEACRYDALASKIEGNSASLAFDTAFLFPEGAPVARLPRRLLVTFVREHGRWGLFDVNALPPPPPPEALRELSERTSS